MIRLTFATCHVRTAALGYPAEQCSAHFWRRLKSVATLDWAAEGGCPHVAGDSHLGLQQKLPILHDLRPVHPDVEISADHINMRGRVPLGAGVCAVRVAEG